MSKLVEKIVASQLVSSRYGEQKKNHRPVTVPPILNNIYERVLSDQLSVYVKDILSDFISAYRKNYSCVGEHTAASNRRSEG